MKLPVALAALLALPAAAQTAPGEIAVVEASSSLGQRGLSIGGRLIEGAELETAVAHDRLFVTARAAALGGRKLELAVPYSGQGATALLGEEPALSGSVELDSDMREVIALLKFESLGEVRLAVCRFGCRLLSAPGETGPEVDAGPARPGAVESRLRSSGRSLAGGGKVLVLGGFGVVRGSVEGFVDGGKALKAGKIGQALSKPVKAQANAVWNAVTLTVPLANSAASVLAALVHPGLGSQVSYGNGRVDDDRRLWVRGGPLEYVSPFAWAYTLSSLTILDNLPRQSSDRYSDDKHELAHALQYKDSFVLDLQLRYLVELARRGYHDNKYEVAARKAERN